MKAMIFAAGLGTRLKPFTAAHPKALVKVGGVPALQRVMLRLKEFGITETVINVHHFANQITDFLKANDNFGLKVHISDESQCLLDTGGGILQARRFLEDETFLIHNADIVTDLDLRPFIAAHNAENSDATLLAQKRQSTRMLYFDEATNLLKGWCNSVTGQSKPQDFISDNTTYARAFGGLHIMSAAIFDRLQEYADAHGRVFSVTNFYLDTVGKVSVRAFTPTKSYRWADIGDNEKLAKANQIFK